jgi:hypothetical protein
VTMGVDTAARTIGRLMHIMRERSRVVDDNLNVPLEDAELLAEVELTTNLIIAASEADATLSQAEVDRLLGLQPEGRSIPPQQRRG